jgi:multidrug efflux system outer membrane protein
MTIQNSNSISVNQPNLKGLSSLVLGLIVLSGCAVGPNYHQPNVTAPAHWGEPMTGGETNSSSSVAAWWKNFNDPELDSLIERAVKSNLDLTISAARVREARAQYRVTSADLWPTVGTSASYERQLQSKNQPIIGALPLPASVPFENNVYQAGFDASWEIDVFGGKRRATEAAKAEVAAAEFGRRDTLVTLLGEAARNYVEARGYQRQLTIARQNITAQEEDLAITQDRFKHGLSSDLDVQQAATLLATTRSQIPTLEMNLQTSIHRLGVLLAQPPGALLEELSTVAPIPAAPPEVPVGLPSELLLRRPDVQKAERQLAAATAQIGVATADLFPKFSARWDTKASAPATGSPAQANSGHLAPPCSGIFLMPAAFAPTSRSRTRGRNRRSRITSRQFWFPLKTWKTRWWDTPRNKCAVVRWRTR